MHKTAFLSYQNTRQDKINISLISLAGFNKCVVSIAGGLVCIVMREEYLEHVAEYRGRLENTMAEMENMGLWRLQSRVVVPRYFFDHTGIVFKFVIC